MKLKWLSLLLLNIVWTLFFAAPLSAQKRERVQLNFQLTDLNYLPGSQFPMEVAFANKSDKSVALSVQGEIRSEDGKLIWDNQLNFELQALQEFKIPLRIPVPQTEGDYSLSFISSEALLTEPVPVVTFRVIQPKKSERLKKILVTVPEEEHALHEFIEQWELEAPSISWGQVVLCGRQTWQRFSNGEKETIQLLDRALKRGMSVIFLDFGPGKIDQGEAPVVRLPWGAKAEFHPLSAPGTGFTIVNKDKELSYNLADSTVLSLNGYLGQSYPSLSYTIQSKGLSVNHWIAVSDSTHFPVTELKPVNNPGRLILCQLTTEGRLEKTTANQRIRPDLPAYDPLAVQIILNLISASVGEEMMR